MQRSRRTWWLVALIVGGGLFTLACSTCGLIPGLGGTATPTLPPPGPAEEATSTPTPTPTPTPAPARGATATPTPGDHPCAGLSASLEVQVLAGPAAAVGLEPFAVGTVPLTVSGQAPYAVSGSGPILYDQTLTENWGTYQVTMDMVFTVSGTCQGESEPGMLQLHIEGSGSQLVEVKSKDFHGTYPWEGSFAFDLSFPIEEGASAEGEGWAFVLHLQELASGTQINADLRGLGADPWGFQKTPRVYGCGGPWGRKRRFDGGRGLAGAAGAGAAAEADGAAERGVGAQADPDLGAGGVRQDDTAERVAFGATGE